MEELGKAAAMTEDILVDRKLCVSARRADRDKRGDGVVDVQGGEGLEKIDMI